MQGVEVMVVDPQLWLQFLRRLMKPLITSCFGYSGGGKKVTSASMERKGFCCLFDFAVEGTLKSFPWNWD